MKRDTPTMKDVAARVGVSDATVSAVFSCSQTNNVRVSDATRQRVLEVAREIGYHPNATARSLRRRHTNIMGFYAGPEFTLKADHPVSAAMLGGMQSGCAGCGRDLLLYGPSKSRSEDDILSALAGGNVDGLVIMVDAADNVVRRLVEYGLPMVSMVDAYPGVPSVVADDEGGMKILVEYLVSRGHTHLAFCPSSGASASITTRSNAYKEAVLRRGLTYTECTPITFSPSLDSYIMPDGLMEWLTLPRDQRATAVAGAYDELAAFFVAYCVQNGLRMPEDLAIAGFDGVVRSNLGGPQLTTIRASWQEVGRQAALLLDRLLRGETIPVRTIVPVELLVGNTA